MPVQACTQASCGLVFEDIRSIQQYDVNPPCLACGASTERTLAARTSPTLADPIVVYRAPDGTFRFPGQSISAMGQRYAAAGYERIDIRGAADMRRFESHMNARERSVMARKLERKLEAREARESQSRSELRRGLAQGFTLPEVDPSTGRRTGRVVNVKLGERGRDLVRHTLQRSNDKPRERTADANFHNQAYSFDRSNREESRDSRGRRQRD